MNKYNNIIPIKRCPFCKEIPKFTDIIIEDDEVDFFIHCSDKRCPTYLGKTYQKSFNNAIKAWNARVNFFESGKNPNNLYDLKDLICMA